MRIRVNLLCLIGASLGLACAFLPWAVASLRLVGGGVDRVWYEVDISGWEIVKDPAEGLFYLWIALVVFISGSVIAFLTPLGGLGQLGGIAIYFLSLKNALPYMLPVPLFPTPIGRVFSDSFSLNVWYYLAILAAIMTLASALFVVRVFPAAGFFAELVSGPALRERLLSVRKEPHDCSLSIVRNINLLCVVGALVGVAALVLSWIYEPPSMLGPSSIRNEPTIVYMVANRYLYYGAAVLFLLGTASSFVSPLGGILQLASLGLFAQGMIGSGDDHWLDGIDPQQQIRAGICLGTASCVLILISLALPFGTGRLRPGRSRSIRLVERLLTISQSMR